MNEQKTVKVCEGRRVQMFKPMPYRKRPVPMVMCSGYFEGICDYIGKPDRCPLTDEEYTKLPEVNQDDIFERMSKGLPCAEPRKERR